MAAAAAEGEDGDLALALQLQELWEAEDGDGDGVASAQPPAVPEPLRPLSVVDEAWELLDPSPDVRGLFVQLNEALFWGRLAAVEVAWSPRMTLYGRERAGEGMGAAGRPVSCWQGPCRAPLGPCRRVRGVPGTGSRCAAQGAGVLPPLLLKLGRWAARSINRCRRQNLKWFRIDQSTT